jgi:hydrogenase small subunit
VYAAAAGIAAGVAIGAMNKKSKAEAASSHQTVTVEELNQESGS